jgi:hypothetical protein
MRALSWALGYALIVVALVTAFLTLISGCATISLDPEAERFNACMANAESWSDVRNCQKASGDRCVAVGKEPDCGGT